jgi:hypothetical protein
MKLKHLTIGAVFEEIDGSHHHISIDKIEPHRITSLLNEGYLSTMLIELLIKHTELENRNVIISTAGLSEIQPTMSGAKR